MTIEVLEESFAVCKVPDFSQVDMTCRFMFLARTDMECSVVCPIGEIPGDALVVETGWKCFRVAGTLDFSLIGILARLTDLLASQQIGVFVVLTFDTDYVLVKQKNLEQALNTLEHNGYQVAR